MRFDAACPESVAQVCNLCTSPVEARSHRRFANSPAIIAAAVLAASVVAYLAPAAFSKSKPTDLKPDWDLTIDRGVEWCAPVDGDPATALLICTKDSRLDLVDVETGRSRLASPVHVQLGTRFAGESERVPFCYGPTFVYAIRATPGAGDNRENAGVLWRVAAAPDGQTEGDPEFMTRLVAAHATPRGVIIVRSDGRVAELAREDGAVLWRRELGDVANGTLHANGETVALLWKQGAAANAAFFDLSQKEPAPDLVEFDTPPIWSELTDVGLIAVWKNRVAVAAPNRPVEWLEMPASSEPASAASIAVYIAGDQDDAKRETNDASPGVILFVANPDAHLSGYCVPTGRELIGRDHLTTPVTRTHRPNPAILRVSGDHIIASGGTNVSVYDPSNGERVARFQGVGAVAGGVHDGVAYGLFCENKWADIEDASPRELQKDTDRESRKVAIKNVKPTSAAAPIRLFRRILPGRPWPRPDEPVDPDVKEYSLGEAHPIRDAFWLGGKLVIVEEKRLRIYSLP